MSSPQRECKCGRAKPAVGAFWSMWGKSGRAPPELPARGPGPFWSSAADAWD